MKRCGICRVSRPVDHFHRRGASGRQGICRDCRKKTDSERYAANPVAHALLRTKRRKDISLWAFELKRGQPCTDCGLVFHPAAMQWDHTGTNKIEPVAEMSNRGVSKTKILAEIAKCEIVCANCHAVRTFERRVAAAVDVTNGM